MDDLVVPDDAAPAATEDEVDVGVVDEVIADEGRVVGVVHGQAMGPEVEHVVKAVVGEGALRHCHAMAVARARGVTPEPFDGFDPRSFAPEADDGDSRRSLDDLVRFNRGSAKTHSGVWRDLAVRKRNTEVDAQIAPIALVGGEVGVPTPLTDRLVELVHDVEEGRRDQGWRTLDALVE